MTLAVTFYSLVTFSLVVIIYIVNKIIYLLCPSKSIMRFYFAVRERSRSSQLIASLVSLSETVCVRPLCAVLASFLDGRQQAAAEGRVSEWINDCGWRIGVSWLVYKSLQTTQEPRALFYPRSVGLFSKDSCITGWRLEFRGER